MRFLKTPQSWTPSKYIARFLSSRLPNFFSSVWQFPFLLALLKPELEVFIFKTQIQKHRSVVTTLI